MNKNSTFKQGLLFLRTTEGVPKSKVFKEEGVITCGDIAQSSETEETYSMDAKAKKNKVEVGFRI